jgi:hypothetical protein
VFPTAAGKKSVSIQIVMSIVVVRSLAWRSGLDFVRVLLWKICAAK